MSNTHNKSYESTTPYTTVWSSLKWNRIEKYVSKLQKRIFRAEREGDSHKVRDLQRMLVYSESALLLAIRRVTQINKGKRTPGIDGFCVLSDEARGELFDSMKLMNIKKHRPKPAYRTYIPKKNGKLRSLGIPAIIDGVIRKFFVWLLSHKQKLILSLLVMVSDLKEVLSMLLKESITTLRMENGMGYLKEIFMPALIHFHMTLF